MSVINITCKEKEKKHNILFDGYQVGMEKLVFVLLYSI